MSKSPAGLSQKKKRIKAAQKDPLSGTQLVTQSRAPQKVFWDEKAEEKKQDAFFTK